MQRQQPEPTSITTQVKPALNYTLQQQQRQQPELTSINTLVKPALNLTTTTTTARAYVGKLDPTTARAYVGNHASKTDVKPDPTTTLTTRA